MKRRFPTLFLAGILVLLLITCNQTAKDAELAQRYCGSCHLFPEPSLLDKRTWEKGVLPEMAFRMGLTYEALQLLSDKDRLEVLKALPQQPMVSEAQWKIIRDYYIKNAPDSIENIKKVNLPLMQQFSVHEFQFPSRSLPLLTFVEYDSLSKKLFIGTRLSKLYQLSSTFAVEDSFKLHSPASDVKFQQDKLVISCMGIMDPNDQAVGRVISLNTLNDTQSLLIDSIKRPVNIEMEDLNNDDEDDFVVSAFGNYTGALLAYEKTDTGFKRHVLHSLPGTRRTIIKDFNKDGLKDILALITQGDEQIILLINEGKFKFRPQVLKRFSPVFGSSYFDLIDFNKDGYIDILYTNGDNADYSPTLKPYHGVRIFLNDGRNQFAEKWFFPMHGASQALARDFDKDGDLDIAAISFFPDFVNHPDYSFIYFTNNNGNFEASITPLAASGRWITISSGDIDHDNDDDILLGALNFTNGAPESSLSIWRAKNTSLLILKNNLYQASK